MRYEIESRFAGPSYYRNAAGDSVLAFRGWILRAQCPRADGTRHTVAIAFRLQDRARLRRWVRSLRARGAERVS